MKQPEQLGPFRILQLLGRGGMGAVYQGIHATTGEPVAVKVLLERFDEETPEARLRFEAEIDALRMLRHPNIVRLNGFGQEDELLYYVMELVCGTTLHKELKKQRGFLWQDVAKIGFEVCLALKHGHDRGITHRDLKPANIMLDNSGVVKIADYGIAHCFGNNRLTGSHAVIGTIEFMSPEQAVAGPVGPKSDIYSLGAVLYALLCRQPPFVAKSLPEIIKKHQNEHLEDIARFRQDAPGDLIRIIRHMLERKPDDRPKNAFVIAKRFEELLSSEFGSPDAVIVLPSKFDDSVQPPAVDETRTAFLDPKVMTGEMRSQIQSGDSKAFSLQYDVTPDENAIESKDSASGKSDKPINENEHPVDADKPSERDSKQHDMQVPPEDDCRNDDVPESSHMSVYYDLTGVGPISNGFSRDMTLQTSAFDHLKSEDQAAPGQMTGQSPLSLDTEGAHDNTSVSARFPTVQTPRSDALRYGSSHFTLVGEDDADYYLGTNQKDNRPLISVQVAVLSICLVMLGLWAWWMLQPPSADKLFRSIADQVDIDAIPPNQSNLLNAESKITKFLELYSQDDRALAMLRLQKELELAKMEKSLERKINSRGTDEKLLPVQRAYLEVISLINTDPEEAMRRLKALITLYETPRIAADKDEAFAKPQQSDEPDLSNPISMTVEIARRRLAELENGIEPIVESQVEQLGRTMERIKLVEEIDPAKAAEMRKAIVELYGDKTWAAKLIETLDGVQPAPVENKF